MRTSNRTLRRTYVRVRLFGRWIADRLWKPLVAWIAYTRTIKTLRETDHHLLRDMGIDRHRISGHVSEMLAADPELAGAAAGRGGDLYRFANDNVTRTRRDRTWLDAA